MSVVLKPPRALAVQVAERISTEIFEGDHLPGSRLTDIAVATRFSVSRNTAREALRKLEWEGLVTSRRHVGWSVRMLTEADARDIYEVRRVLEGTGVRQTAEVTISGLQVLQHAVDEERQAAAGLQWLRLGTASLRFHLALVSFLGSARMTDFFARTLTQLRLVFIVMPDESEYQLQWLERDERLAGMILSGHRGEAHRELLAYLDDSEAEVIDFIRSTANAEVERAPHPILDGRRTRS